VLVLLQGNCVFGDCDCLLAFIFAAIESNVDEFDEGGNFEDSEEAQGQAKQGKPPLLVAYLDPNFIYASISIYVYSKMHCFFFVIAITS
jgi:hypothetical protein